MSHMSKVRAQIKDLDRAEDAVRQCGGVLLRDVRSHKWFQGQGKCEHVIRAADYHPGDYEIGLVRSADGESWDMHFDTYATGRKLVETFGPDMKRFKSEYSAAVGMARAHEELVHLGWEVSREVLPGNRVRVVMTQA
jgi:hypothetical protein